MFDQNSYGYSVLTYNEIVGQEPISVEDVKEYIGLNFAEHDSQISGLITLIRIAAEEFLNVTLIESRKVDVSWLEMRGSEVLPFQIISGDIVATSLDGNDVYSPSIIRDTKGATLLGDYPNGIRLSYTSTRVPENYILAIRSGLVRSVACVFEDDELIPRKVLSKQLSGLKFLGNFTLPS